MALHNVDKGNVDRSTPRPNIHDTIEVNMGRMAHGTNSVNYLKPGELPSSQSALYGGNKRLVQSGDVIIQGDGTNVTVSSFAHNLGFAPLAEGSVNNANVTNITGQVNVPLPTWLGTDLTGTSIAFTMWLSIMADATNVYFYTLNKTGSPFAVTVTYYLYQQQQQVTT